MRTVKSGFWPRFNGSWLWRCVCHFRQERFYNIFLEMQAKFLPKSIEVSFIIKIQFFPLSPSRREIFETNHPPKGHEIQGLSTEPF